ncbi:hypothetical protein BDV93DRAFT_551144 [Ceratobasidium sp. AG-I]|nr:hypothetical protein BDV93DRAFT_551144 [Ceratobasidium sp. AG-I]
MAGRKKQVDNTAQHSLKHWFSSQKSTASTHAAPSSPVQCVTSSGAMVAAELGPEAKLEATRKRPGSISLKPTQSFGSNSTLSPAPPSDAASPVRRSVRLKTVTPVSKQKQKPPRVFVRQPVACMPPIIKRPSPERDSPRPRRTSPPCDWLASDPSTPSSDTEEVPSSQKDDDEPMLDDLDTLASIPVFHVSSPATSDSSDELPTPAPLPATPPRPLSPDSKTRQIVAEIRAKARLVASPTSPTAAKRSHPPSDDSDSDALPEADFFFGNKGPPAKRRASSVTPSPPNVRRSARKSKRPSTKSITVAIPRPKPKPNPFAAIVRERAAREKRSLALPRATDGSLQDVFAIANAALLRDPDATFEDSVAETSMLDADDALDQLAEGGFAGEAERIRKASATMLPPSWTVFGDSERVKAELLVVFPETIATTLQTPRAKGLWKRIGKWIAAKDYDTLETILDCSLLHTTLSDPKEQAALEPIITWLIEMAILCPHTLLASAAARVAESLIPLLPISARMAVQDRLATHIARCVLRIGSPRDGVLFARELLGGPKNAAQETYVSLDKRQKEHRMLLCASLLRSLQSAQAIFPALSVLSVLAIDPTVDSLTNLELGRVAEEWACKAQDTESQLSVCYTLVGTLGSLPVQQKRDIVRRVFRGTRTATGRMSMWLATAFADGLGMDDISPETYAQCPPLPRIHAYIRTLHITPQTHYPDLLATVQLLDIALWDVDALVETERNQGRSIKYQPGVPVDSEIGDVMNRLSELHGRIRDARAADLERTRTKACLQTLQVRLGWDLLNAARRSKQSATTIREMWGRPRPVVL